MVLRYLPGNHSPCSYKHSYVYFMSTHLLQATHMLCVELAPLWVLGYKTMPMPMPCQLHSQGGNMTIWVNKSFTVGSLGSRFLTLLGELPKAALPPRTWTRKPQPWTELLYPFAPHGGACLRQMPHCTCLGEARLPRPLPAEPKSNQPRCPSFLGTGQLVELIKPSYRVTPSE